MDPFIRLQSVAKRYPSAHSFVTVLENFNFTVEHGEFLAVMGRSGAGKTTLLNLIGGLDTPDSGKVMVAGTWLNGLDQHALTRWRAAHVGFVFQSHYLMPMLTAADNVALPLMLTRLSRKARREKVEMALARVGLAERAGHWPGQLSGGQQQRVGIARALIGGAPVLLCDEPTAGLDRAAADLVLGLLRDLSAEGRTVVMVTHDPLAVVFAHRRFELLAPA
jgi:putative ABC transport system ATP-binding protein